MVLDEDDAERLDEDVEDTIDERDVDVPTRDDGLAEGEDERPDECDRGKLPGGHLRHINLALGSEVAVPGDAAQAGCPTVQDTGERLVSIIAKQ